jgi:hypothetical protein
VTSAISATASSNAFTTAISTEPSGRLQ